MFFKFNKLGFLAFALAISFLLSCSENKKDAKSSAASVSGKGDANNIEVQQATGRIKTIFYNIPSPVEMSELMQRANLVYDSEILNSVEKIDQYTSTKSMALNLGVYGADLSYTRLYDQIQESINYLTAIKKLSEQLGVPQDEGAFAVNKLEENINNRDSLLFIITDVYANADVYLKENERSGTAALIIFGGWIEALYISTNIIDEENPSPEVMERIAEQKFSVENIIQLLNLHFANNSSLDEIFGMLNELKVAYDKVELITNRGEVITDEENKRTSINSKTQIYVNFDQIKEIKSINDKLRAHIIS